VTDTTQLFTTSNFIGPCYHAVLLFSGPDRTGNYVILGAKTGKLPFFKMSERFVGAGLVDNFIAEQENKATLQ